MEGSSPPFKKTLRASISGYFGSARDSLIGLKTANPKSWIDKEPANFLNNLHLALIVDSFQGFSAEVRDELCEIYSKHVRIAATDLHHIESPSRNESFTAILNFQLEIFRRNISEITEFLNLRNEFESSFALGRFDEANGMLDRSVELFGETIWSITNKLILATEHDFEQDLHEEISRYLKRIKNPFVQYLIYHFQKLLVVQSPKMHRSSISSIIEKFRRDGELDTAGTISYYTIPLEYDAERELVSCVPSQLFFPIFDQFLFFKRSIEEFSITKDLSDLSSRDLYVKELAEKFFSETLPDLCPFKKLDHIHSPDSEVIESALNEVIVEYSSGNYNDVISQVEKLVGSDTRFLSLAEIYCKSVVLSASEVSHFNKDYPMARLVSGFVDVIKLGRDANMNINSLEVMLMRLSTQEWPMTFYSQLFNAFPSYFYVFRNCCIPKDVISASYSTPRTKLQFLNGLESDFFEDVSQALKETNSGSIDVPISRELKHKIYTGEIFLDSRIVPDDPHLLPFEYTRLKAHSLLEAGDVREASRTIAVACSENENASFIFPIARVLDAIKRNSYDEYTFSLNRAVLNAVYFRNISDDRLFDLGLALERHLTLLGVVRPTEFYTDIGTLCEVEIYFLRYVCIQSVLDTTRQVEGTENIETERLKILEILLEKKDIDGRELLEVEHENILTSAIIRNLTSQIGRGKISVDTEKMREAKYAYFSDTFHLYTTRRLLEDYGFEAESTAQDNVQNILHSSSVAILSRLVVEFIDDFVNNTKYGLNVYLSSEIRHGIFENQIKPRAQECHLLVRKSGNRYELTEYWANMHPSVPQEAHRAIATAIAEFSERFDELVMHGMTRLDIQKGEKDSHKLFKFPAESEQMNHLHIKASMSNGFDEFYKVLEEYMWERVEGQLKDVKRWLWSEYMPKLIGCVEDLQENVLAILGDGQSFPDLIDSILALKEGIKADIADMMEWFERAPGVSSLEITVRHGVEVAVGILSKILSPMPLAVTIQHGTIGEGFDEPKLYGIECKHFMIGLITSLNNCLEYGVANTETPINILGSYRSSESWDVAISNLCKEEFKSFDPDQWLNDYIASDPDEFLVKEKGTGLYKIKHLVESVLKGSKVIPDKPDNDHFRITIEVSK